MSDFSLWHLLAVILLIAYAIPIAAILQRTGYSKWWTPVFFIPIVDLAALWIFAYARWPAYDEATR